MGETLDYINNAIANGECDSEGCVFTDYDSFWQDADYEDSIFLECVRSIYQEMLVWDSKYDPEYPREYPLAEHLEKAFFCDV